MMVGRVGPRPPNMSFCPTVAASWLRLAPPARIAFGAGETPRARLESRRVERAGRRQALDERALLIARGFTAPLRNRPTTWNRPSFRASTIRSTACPPTPFQAGGGAVNRWWPFGWTSKVAPGSG